MINGNPNARLQTALLFAGLALLAVSSLVIYTISTRIDSSVQPTAISLNAEHLELRVGDQVTLQVQVTPAKATLVGKNQFASSDKQVASVYPGGTVIANGPGQAVITVTRDGLTTICTVTVK